MNLFVDPILSVSLFMFSISFWSLNKALQEAVRTLKLLQQRKKIWTPLSAILKM